MSKLKQANYFFSQVHPIHQFDQAYGSVIKQRDDWLKHNKEKVSKIENEELKTIINGHNNGHIMLLIQINYYFK